MQGSLRASAEDSPLALFCVISFAHLSMPTAIIISWYLTSAVTLTTVHKSATYESSIERKESDALPMRSCLVYKAGFYGPAHRMLQPQFPSHVSCLGFRSHWQPSEVASRSFDSAAPIWGRPRVLNELPTPPMFRYPMWRYSLLHDPCPHIDPPREVKRACFSSNCSSPNITTS